jgi:hypothetical protein
MLDFSRIECENPNVGMRIRSLRNRDFGLLEIASDLQLFWFITL